MHDHVEPGGPGIRQNGVECFAGVKDGGHRIAQKGNPSALPRVPQRPAPCVPLLLYSEIEGVIETGRVAKSKLGIIKQNRIVNDQQQTQETAQTQEGQAGVAYHTALESRGLIGYWHRIAEMARCL